jgi:hypothetical protein
MDAVMGMDGEGPPPWWPRHPQTRRLLLPE